MKELQIQMLQENLQDFWTKYLISKFSDGVLDQSTLKMDLPFLKGRYPTKIIVQDFGLNLCQTPLGKSLIKVDN